jgi:DNA-binding NtrC family response regulator
MKIGADDYLPKPFTNEELRAAVDKALGRLPIRRAAAGRGGEARADGLVGESAAMRRLFAEIERVPEDVPVLVVGEAGSGRMAIARAVHLAGRRAVRPFVPVPCGAVPGDLAADLLCQRDRGMLRAAAGGTLALSGIERLSPEAQDRLLAEAAAWSGGGRAARLIAIASTDLDQAASRGTFRPELLARLRPTRLEVPPLRERVEDVALLANRFAEAASRRLGREPMRFTEAALEALRAHSWPGNVRELSDLVDRLAETRDVVDVLDLPPCLRFSARPAIGGGRTLAEVEGDHIRAVLADVDGNKTRAAQILGIDRKTLREKVGEPERR